MVALHDFPTMLFLADVILKHDPLDQIHVFGVGHDALELAPVVDHQRVVPDAIANLSLAVKAPAIEAVADERPLALDLQPELSPGAAEERPELGKVRQPLTRIEGLIAAGSEAIDDCMSQKVLRHVTDGLAAEAAVGDEELDCLCVEPVLLVLETARRQVVLRSTEPPKVDLADAPLDSGDHVGHEQPVILPRGRHLSDLRVLPRHEVEGAAIHARDRAPPRRPVTHISLRGAGKNHQDHGDKNKNPANHFEPPFSPSYTTIGHSLPHVKPLTGISFGTMMDGGGPA
jgi:hypothetical protein